VHSELLNFENLYTQALIMKCFLHDPKLQGGCHMTSHDIT